MKEIAARVKQIIGNRSQKDAAAALGISQQYLCDILQGRRHLSAKVAVMLNGLGVDIQEAKALYARQAEIEFYNAWRELCDYEPDPETALSSAEMN